MADMSRTGFASRLSKLGATFGIIGLLWAFNALSWEDGMFHLRPQELAHHAAGADLYDDHMGIAGEDISRKDMNNIGAAWIYHWSATPDSYTAGMFQTGGYHIPATFRLGYYWWTQQGFYFGDYGCGDQQCKSAIDAKVAAYLDHVPANDLHYYVLGNEPNEPGRDSDGDAYNQGYNVYIRQYRILVDVITAREQARFGTSDRVRIVGPSMSNWTYKGANGRAWLTGLGTDSDKHPGFLEAYKALWGSYPRMDVLNIHLYEEYPNVISGNPNYINGDGTWYGTNAASHLRLDLQDFRNRLDSVAGGIYRGKPVWITEFGMVHCPAGANNPSLSSCPDPNDPYVVTAVRKLLYDSPDALLPFFHNNASPAGLNLGRWFIFTSHSGGAGRYYPITLLGDSPGPDRAYPITGYGECKRSRSLPTRD
jgi:hypothetical protein